jgi:hypothetical protein
MTCCLDAVSVRSFADFALAQDTGAARVDHGAFRAEDFRSIPQIVAAGI